MLLAVPLFPQEHGTSCVPAAVRMVLSFWSIERDELELSQILQSEEEGTSVFSIELLEDAGVGVVVESGEFEVEQIKQNLDQGVPIVVAVYTAALPYWEVNRPHAVVIVGYDEGTVYLNDPQFPDVPQSVMWEEFVAAWEEFGRFGAIIRKREL